ncbi:hypothetical protein ACJMK2_022195 [Sinanodonta woodiana]|uniref:Uncharacterized protein n=1 Tax=Sinanodonta woodiana TaxID=1069815 RepID=A0ABD3TKV4_SINWO
MNCQSGRLEIQSVGQTTSAGFMKTLHIVGATLMTPIGIFAALDHAQGEFPKLSCGVFLEQNGNIVVEIERKMLTEETVLTHIDVECTMMNIHGQK